MALFGLHNQANALAALAAGELLGLDHAAMLEVLVEFPGLAKVHLDIVESLQFLLCLTEVGVLAFQTGHRLTQPNGAYDTEHQHQQKHDAEEDD